MMTGHKIRNSRCAFAEAMTIEEGVDRVLRQCLAVRKGENVLVVADLERRVVGEAFFQGVKRVEAVPVLSFIHPLEKASPEPPSHLSSFMLECDAIIMATGTSMTHTKARQRASRAGARIASLPGVTEESLSEGGLTADYEEIARLLRILDRKLRNCKKVHVVSGKGTDLTFSVKGRVWITQDNGLAEHKSDFVTLPAGEIFVSPAEGSGEGRLVFDARLHDIVEQPATVILKEGYVAKVNGAKDAVAQMNKGGKDGRNFAKFGFGLNPRTRAQGPIAEAQKTLGCAHLAFGGSVPFGGKVVCDVRVDGIMRDVTIDFDGKVLLERGKLLI